jgi:hypothetical protein
MHNILTLLSLLAALAGMAPAIAVAADTLPRKGRPVSTEQDAFSSVPLNTRQASACSPAAPDDAAWQGILVRAPDVVLIGGAGDAGPVRPRGPLCGLYRIGLDRLADGVPMLLKATERATGRRYTGVVLDRDGGHDEPPPARRAIDPARLARMVTSSYFNLDLFDYLSLPLRAGSYLVQAEYGGLTSNTVLIELREAPR